jgi:hypothetical protein
MDFDAAFTRECPMALEIKGTVLEALGFTSIINISLSFTAN